MHSLRAGLPVLRSGSVLLCGDTQVVQKTGNVLGIAPDVLVLPRLWSRCCVKAGSKLSSRAAPVRSCQAPSELALDRITEDAPYLIRIQPN